MYRKQQQRQSQTTVNNSSYFVARVFIYFRLMKSLFKILRLETMLVSLLQLTVLFGKVFFNNLFKTSCTRPALPVHLENADK